MEWFNLMGYLSNQYKQSVNFWETYNFVPIMQCIHRFRTKVDQLIHKSCLKQCKKFIIKNCDIVIQCCFHNICEKLQLCHCKAIQRQFIWLLSLHQVCSIIANWISGNNNFVSVVQEYKSLGYWSLAEYWLLCYICLLYTSRCV